MTILETLPDHPDPDRQPEFYTGVSVKRLMAWFIDNIIIGLLLGLLTLTSTVALVWPLAYVILDFFYRVSTMTMGSGTWGMRIVGMEFRNRRGERFNSGDALVHTLAYSVCVAFPLLLIINVFLIAFGAKGQAVHDYVVGSVAINATR